MADGKNSSDKTPSIVSGNIDLVDANSTDGLYIPIIKIQSPPPITIVGSPDLVPVIESSPIDDRQPSIADPDHQATITVKSNNLLSIENTAASIQFTIDKSSTKFRNEIGVFLVDDELGSVNGVLPGARGYLRAVLERSQIILGNVDEILPLQNTRQLEFPPGSKLGFYLVQDGTTAEIRMDLAGGKNPSHPVFFQAGNADSNEHLQITQSGNNYTLAWQDSVGDPQHNFDDLVLNATLTTKSLPWGTEFQGSQPVVNLRDISGVQPASVMVGGNAAYDNFIGFYTVDDPTGKIGNLKPSDSGYARAAIDRSVANYHQNVGIVDLHLDGGKLLAPYLIANGNAQDFLAKNPTNQGGGDLTHAYFGYIGANPDKLEHLRLLGDNKFAFEDTFGGGDRDFNDATVQLNIIT